MAETVPNPLDPAGAPFKRVDAETEARVAQGLAAPRMPLPSTLEEFQAMCKGQGSIYIRIDEMSPEELIALNETLLRLPPDAIHYTSSNLEDPDDVKVYALDEEQENHSS